MVSLVGTLLPDCTLQSTAGNWINLATLGGRVVVFFYPYTGKPGTPDPAGWDDIPGAHGSTPQARAFSNSYDDFAKLDAKVFGVSFQNTEWQQEFVARNALRYPLLSDADRFCANALDLETFRAGENDFLVRRTLIASGGIIAQDFYPVLQPVQNAVDVLKALKP